MRRTFYNIEKSRQLDYYNQYLSGLAHNMGEFRGKHEFILREEDSIYNLFEPIRSDVLTYFNNNRIKWWGENNKVKKPTGHLVSSQIHCLNHLFALRKDPNAVKCIIESATGLQFDEVLPSLIADNHCYISFEFAFHNDEWLQENDKGAKRGSMCTSIDAMILARRGEERWLIPIEWKYTETYTKKDKTNATRMKRYAHLIEYSSQLKMPDDGIAHSVYFIEPSYELMRQTLLCEQIIAHGYADHFFHINIIPNMHYELRNAVESMFVPMLNDKSKFRIIDPQELLAPLKETNKYDTLFSYLNTRYWQ